MRKRSILRVGIGLVATTVLVACGGGKEVLPTTPATPVTPVTPSTPIVRGEPVGQHVSATIGASGGSIALPDGSVTIAIPSGAVNANTTFTVTPIRNIAPGGAGTGIRIEPANLRFSVPVTVTFNYQSVPTDTLDELGMALAWQDSTGAWFGYVNSTVTPAVSRVSTKAFASTKAASGGAVQAPVKRSGDLVRTYYWVPYPSTQKVIDLDVGTSQQLSVYTCAREQAGASRALFGTSFDDVDEDLAPLPTDPVRCPRSTRVGTWDVFGIVGGTSTSGTVSTAQYLPVTSRAYYTAPDRVPPTNPVFVTGSLRWHERGVSKPFTWKIRIVPLYIPLHVDAYFHNPSAQVYNSSYFTTADVYDTLSFDIDLARRTFEGVATDESIKAGNHDTVIKSGGLPVMVSGLEYCAPFVPSSIFEIATLRTATAAAASQGIGTSISFALKAFRSIKGAKVFVGVGSQCGAIEETPSVSSIVDLGTTVTADFLPTKPGEQKVIDPPGGYEKWVFTYRQ